jgi:hypothetical protein
MNVDGALDARRARPTCLKWVRAARVHLAEMTARRARPAPEHTSCPLMRMSPNLTVHLTRAARVQLACSQRAPRASNLAKLSARRARPTTSHKTEVHPLSGIHISCLISEIDINISCGVGARRSRPTWLK